MTINRAAVRDDLAQQRDAFQRRRRCVEHANEMRRFARWLNDVADEGDVPSAIATDVYRIANSLHLTANRLGEE